MTVYLHTRSPGVRGGRPVLHGTNRDLTEALPAMLAVHSRIARAAGTPAGVIEVELLDTALRPVARLEMS